MYKNKCTKCGIEFETKNPKRVICPGCLYPDKKDLSLDTYNKALNQPTEPAQPAPVKEDENFKQKSPGYYIARDTQPQQGQQERFNRPYNQGYNQNRPSYNDRGQGYNDRNQGGYNQDRNQGYAPRPQRPPGGYNNNRDGGYNNNREGGYNNNREGGYNRDSGYNNNREGGYNNNRDGGGGYNRSGGYNNDRNYNNSGAGGGFRRPQSPRPSGGFSGGGNSGGGFKRPYQQDNRRPPFNRDSRGPRRPGPEKKLLISREQVAEIEAQYKLMLPLPNPDCHEVIAEKIGIEANKVFFGINLVRQKMNLPKLPYPKRKLAISIDQLNAIKSLYEPLLPLPPIGCHKFLAKQLKMDEWRVHVGIGIIRKQMSLPRWNTERDDAPAEFKNQPQKEEKPKAEKPKAEKTEKVKAEKPKAKKKEKETEE